MFAAFRKILPTNSPEKIFAVAANELGIVVTVTERGVVVNTIETNWDDVTRIDVFKQDTVIYDIICMDVYDRSGKHMLVDENMAGWHELIGAIPRFLPKCLKSDDWYARVAIPAFELCWTTIYYRYSIESPAAE